MDVELVDGVDVPEAVKAMFRYHAELPAKMFFNALRVMDVRPLDPWEMEGSGDAPYAD
jgi:hypothetical protein